MNKIGDAGLLTLCDAIKVHLGLKELDLRRNAIGNAGVQASLAMALVAEYRLIASRVACGGVAGHVAPSVLCHCLTPRTTHRAPRTAHRAGTAQALVAMLAMGGAPEMRIVKLARNDGIDSIGRTIASGLKFLRKELVVDFDDAGLMP